MESTESPRNRSLWMENFLTSGMRVESGIGPGTSSSARRRRFSQAARANWFFIASIVLAEWNYRLRMRETQNGPDLGAWGALRKPVRLNPERGDAACEVGSPQVDGGYRSREALVGPCNLRERPADSKSAELKPLYRDRCLRLRGSPSGCIRNILRRLRRAATKR